MVSNREIFKKIIGKVGAVLMIGSLMLFTFVGCEKKKAPAEPIEFVEQVETDYAEKTGGNYANEIDLTQKPVEVQNKREVTVNYDQCNVGQDVLTVINEEGANYVVKKYEAPIFTDYMKGLDYTYNFNEENGEVYVGDRLISDRVEVLENGDLLVRDYQLIDSIPVVKYLRTENGVEARYIATAPKDSHLVSGMSFLMEQVEEGVYRLDSVYGVFNENIDNLLLYEGDFIGWSVNNDNTPTYKADDHILVDKDMNLVPCFEENEASKVAKENGECEDGQLEEIDGQVVLRCVRGNAHPYALSGLDVENDTVRTTDGKPISKELVENIQEVEKPEVEEPKVEKKKEEPKTEEKKEEPKVTPTPQSVVEQPVAPQPTVPQQPVVEQPVTPQIPTTESYDNTSMAEEWGGEWISADDWDSYDVGSDIGDDWTFE